MLHRCRAACPPSGSPRATAHRSARFVSIRVSAFCPPYDSARAEHALTNDLRRARGCGGLRAFRAPGSEEMQVLFGAERVGEASLGQLYVGIADDLIAPDRTFQRASFHQAFRQIVAVAHFAG